MHLHTLSLFHTSKKTHCPGFFLLGLDSTSSTCTRFTPLCVCVCCVLEKLKGGSGSWSPQATGARALQMCALLTTYRTRCTLLSPCHCVRNAFTVETTPRAQCIHSRNYTLRTTLHATLRTTHHARTTHYAHYSLCSHYPAFDSRTHILHTNSCLFFLHLLFTYYLPTIYLQRYLLRPIGSTH